MKYQKFEQSKEFLMKKLLFQILLASFLLIPSTISYAQPLSILGFHFKKNDRKKLKANFELHNNLLVIKMAINHLDTLNFVIDTGVGYTLITDPEVMHTLNLACVRKVKVAGAGINDVLEGCIVNVNSMSFQGIQTFNYNLIVLEKDVLELSKYAGIKIHGLIGYDLLSRFVVKIDYLAKIITFYHPQYFNYRGKGEKFKISIEEMKPYIHAEATLTAGTIPVKLILDTGAGHSLSLEQGAHPSIQVPHRHIPSSLGVTLNGNVFGAIGRIDKMKIGSFELDKVITSFPDTSSLRFIRNVAGRQGNLGLGVLKRFLLIFNYPENELILKPNKHFKEPFEFSTSGIELIAESPHYKIIKIGYIRKESPAYQAGVMVGDEVIAIDDKITSQITLNEAYKVLNKKDGKRTVLLLKRANKLFFVEVLLKEPI